MVYAAAASALCWPMQWIRNFSPQAAGATLGLIVIQVGIGVVMKAAQTSGSYSFSPSASVTISEFLKLLLSLALFYRQWQQRPTEYVKFADNGEESAIPLTTTISATDGKEEQDKEREVDFENGYSASFDAERGHLVAQPRSGLAAFWIDLRSSITEQKSAGYYVLALCYTLIKNSIFVCYKLADAGTIQLAKSSRTGVTALILTYCLNASISKLQWIAIVIQMFGLILTQYKASSGTTYPWTTYSILLLQVILSASSGVYNQYLLKQHDSNLHVDNMLLYASGTFVNLLCHIMLRSMSPDEPGFFQGYTSAGAVMVIVSNVFIGLAITAVYKYANAVIKCFATALSTGILLCIATLLLGTELGEMSHQYATSGRASSFDVVDLARGMYSKFCKTLLFIFTLLTMASVAFLTLKKSEMPGFSPMADVSPGGSVSNINRGSDSAFGNSLAMIRFNSARPERIPMLKKYEPFFHTVHISMPELMPEHPADFHNLTVDQYPNVYTIYKMVSDLMETMLADTPPEGARFRCMSDTGGSKWWGYGEGHQNRVLAAIKEVEGLGLDYKVHLTEWCFGWSDIYYIPRRFFADFIILAKVFLDHEAFHELAIPTIVRIIDDSRRASKEQTELDVIKDCWGWCCASNPTMEDVLTARCGHRLNYLDENVTNAFYNKLDNRAKLLEGRREHIEERGLFLGNLF
ncbi:hypothetical protein DCS_03256 [Drechmeria coniospora]|uniref:UDP-galactose transporter n=1 Tax=Drechmeria coniospora TaxID=98403 RepID=A0A151GYC0_DRECN|nr:hypothetical protein DCS_03256 [Drechmeria coniospora]KYK62109.1 hypothetical protein DCS_03256 [Drechmeria coniospora]